MQETISIEPNILKFAFGYILIEPFYPALLSLFLSSFVSFTLYSLLSFFLSFSIFFSLSYGPVSWGCRIHRLHLGRGVRPDPTQRVLWIWHKTIWWLSSSNAGASGNTEYSFIVIAIAPKSSLIRSNST